jgi:hypothetical protein
VSSASGGRAVSVRASASASSSLTASSKIKLPGAASGEGEEESGPAFGVPALEEVGVEAQSRGATLGGTARRPRGALLRAFFRGVDGDNALRRSSVDRWTLESIWKSATHLVLEKQRRQPSCVAERGVLSHGWS